MATDKYNWTNDLDLINKNSSFYIQTAKELATTNRLATATNILDVGCGTGELLFHFFKFANEINTKKITLVDSSEMSITRARERFKLFNRTRFYCVEIKEFYEKYTEKFDFILASHVFYYLTPKIDFVHHLLDLLDKNGVLVIIMRNPKSDGFKIREAIGVIEQKNTKKFFHAQHLSNILTENSVKFANIEVEHKITIPINDYESFVKFGHTKELKNNVIACYLRLMGHRNKYSWEKANILKLHAIIDNFLKLQSNELINTDTIFFLHK